MKKKVVIRLAEPDDLPEIQTLFVETIKTVCRYDYSPEQIAAWTSSGLDVNRWSDKLKKQYFIIAQIRNQMVGFASLNNNGYFDLIYVHKDYQRQGIADQLYAAIESKANQYGMPLLTADVSITARPFFEKNGFIITKEQINVIRGIEIINFKMIKELK